MLCGTTFFILPWNWSMHITLLDSSPQQDDHTATLHPCIPSIQEKEVALSWPRQHDVKHQGISLRIYPDLSITLTKRRSAFNNVKGALYQKGVSFRHLFPACLKVTFKGESHLFKTPEEAWAFYDCVAK